LSSLCIARNPPPAVALFACNPTQSADHAQRAYRVNADKANGDWDPAATAEDS